MQDPYLTLGVPRDASDEEIRQAYLAAIHRCPPEQDPVRFQAIRGAYETLRTEKSRLEYALFDTELPTPNDLIVRLAKGDRPGRPGIDLFRELLRGTPRRVGNEGSAAQGPAPAALWRISGQRPTGARCAIAARARDRSIHPVHRAGGPEKRGQAGIPAGQAGPGALAGADRRAAREQSAGARRADAPPPGPGPGGF